ncbi:hypothetical protein BaRGS_00015029 [Batillaria attramentaria]|uniref:G-protein coupled receptors family 1 profile domain-containing protein n=1 Tax=Batillaria attramentaria TaxID=370345 RepID=A0ABD0L2L0_9CAEN
MLSLFSVVGVIGNAIAFYIFFLRRNSGTSVIFILALAGTDFVTCLVTIPFTIVFEAVRYNLRYDIVCKMYFFFICSTIPYSSFIMAAIAFDRYFCICHPFMHVFTIPRARLIVLCLAIPAFSFGIITGMTYGIYMVHDALVTNGSVLVNTNVSVQLATDGFGNPFPLVSIHDTGALKTGFLLESQIELDRGNDSKVYDVMIHRQMLHNTECVKNYIYFDDDFQMWYHYIYTSCYVLCFFIVIVLYVLIYRFIHARRAMKAKRRKKKYYTSVANTEPHVPTQAAPREAETAMTELTGNGNITTTISNNMNTTNVDTLNGVKNTNGTHKSNDTAGETSRLPKRRPSTNRDRTANIKTAIMLFVVTLVFIFAFLPAWLMAHGLIEVQFEFLLDLDARAFLNVFYFYFVYNVANPFIYAFMNQSFREDLKKLLKRS